MMKRFFFVLCIFIVMLLSSLLAFGSYGVGLEKRGIYHTLGAIEGGDITDGVILGEMRYEKRDGFERILLGFYHGSYLELGSPLEKAPFFRVQMEEYPLRLKLEIYGVRGFLASFPSFEKSYLIKGMSRLPLLDDSAISLCICFKRGVAYEVFFLEDPAYIVIDVIEDERELGPPIYSLRTRGYEGQEEAGQIEELLFGYGSERARVLKDVDGDLVVEEGYYFSLGEALEAWWAWMEMDLSIRMVIEKRERFEFPGAGPLLY